MTTARSPGNGLLIAGVMDRLAPLVDVYKPYVDGLEHLPEDGRILLVGNHTQGGGEVFLIPYLVHRRIGTRVRPLADKRFGDMSGPPARLMTAYGAVVGTPENARMLMQDDETILVFPGGGREISKASDQLYMLMWQGRNGFARLAAEHDYPIVPVALVGGDDVYHVLTSSTGRWARATNGLSARLTGRTDMAMPLMRGIGPTMIPRPQRMYLRFGAPIDTTRPAGTTAAAWTLTVREQAKTALEADLAGLLEIRATDPYRQLAPWAWTRAVTAESRA